MSVLLFLVAAMIFFLLGADITEIDVVWGFFFLALGLCVGGTPVGDLGWWRNRR